MNSEVLMDSLLPLFVWTYITGLGTPALQTADLSARP